MKKPLFILLSLILFMTAVSCGQSDHDCPTSYTETYFDGVEYTITLDKSEYDLGDTVKATVSIVNKTDARIELYSPVLSYFFSVGFTENGVGKFSKGYAAAPDALRATEIYPDEGFVYVEEFDLDAPIGTEEPIRADSEWKIHSSATIILDPYGEEKYEDISVEIVVPH